MTRTAALWAAWGLWQEIASRMWMWHSWGRLSVPGCLCISNPRCHEPLLKGFAEFSCINLEAGLWNRSFSRKLTDPNKKKVDAARMQQRVCSLVLFCHGVTYKWCFWLILKFVNRLLAHGSLSVLVVRPVFQLSRDLQSWPHQVRRGAPSLCTWAVDTSAVLSCTGAASVAICGRLLSGPGTAGTERRWRTCGFYQLVLVGLPLLLKQICSPGGTWQQAAIPAPLGSALWCRALCDPLLQFGFQFLTGTSLHWCHWAVSICHSLLSSWGAPMGWLSERSSCSAGADFSLVLWKKKNSKIGSSLS